MAKTVKIVNIATDGVVSTLQIDAEDKKENFVTRAYKAFAARHAMNLETARGNFYVQD